MCGKYTHLRYHSDYEKLSCTVEGVAVGIHSDTSKSEKCVQLL